jgi:transcriptional regulator with XRE-family HTH domain
MSPQELKSARAMKGWSQPEAAHRLGVSQSYLAMLETGQRSATPELARKFMRTFGMDATVLELPKEFQPQMVDAQSLAEDLGALGYPGFEYLKSRATKKKNPGEVLMTVLSQDAVEQRVVEALPWLVLKYWRTNRDWLLKVARNLNLQNRLGFTVDLARSASRAPDQDRDAALLALEDELNKSRLAVEGVYLKPMRTEAERRWTERNRTEDARHWNLLTLWRPEHLQYVP